MFGVAVYVFSEFETDEGTKLLSKLRVGSVVELVACNDFVISALPVNF